MNIPIINVYYVKICYIDNFHIEYIRAHLLYSVWK